MSNGGLDTDKHVNLRTAYEQICVNHRAIDDFRSNLLGLLPLASGAGIFLLLSEAFTKDQQHPLPHQFLLPIGVFGFLVTLGLYFYELRGIQYCTHLIAAGRSLEEQLNVQGRFSTRPKRHVAGFISELSAAHAIYSAVLAAWIFVATVFAVPPHDTSEAPAILLASLLAAAIFFIVFILALRLDLRPPAPSDASASVLSAMLEMIKSSPIAANAGDDIVILQRHMQELSQKNLAPTSSDWQTLHNIISKFNP